MKSRLKYRKDRLAAGLAYLLFLQFAIPAVAQVPQPGPTQLNIVVVEGEGAVNNVYQRANREAIVRIEDENKRPVANAAVVFTLSTQGASGEFANGSKSMTLMTDAEGRAATRLRPNSISGKLNIHVNASYRGLNTRTIVTQFNMVVPGSKRGGSGKVWIIVGLVGAAAAGGVIVATHGSKSSSAGTPTTPAAVTIGITPGTGTIGPPH
jgi:hypothetical protein